MDEKISSVSNYSVLTKVLDFFLDSNTTANAEQSASETSTREQYKPYLYSDKDNTSEDMVLATHTALKKSCLRCSGTCIYMQEFIRCV